LAVTSLGLAGWLPPKDPATFAMFAADSFATLIERGAYTVEWSPIHGQSPTFLDEKNQPQGAYYGIKLLHQIASTGDTFVTASTETETLAVHATKRRDGGLGLLFINKDLVHAVSITVTINGYVYASKGTRYDYGKPNIDAGKDSTETPIDGLGPTFTVEVPRFALTAIVIPKAQ
jgi:hypothetical protein